MEKVTGIGGFFFLSKDSAALNDWYERHLGVRKCGQEYEHGSWWQDEGPTVFGAEAPEHQEQFGRPDQVWRVNFRVRDLEAMVAQLRAAGIEVSVDDTEYPNGRFAYLMDPEGNSIELWQAGGTDATRPNES
jgi:predicted enzyme related to lactoylglutathione lyase